MKMIPLEESRLEELVTLWNKEIGHEFPMRETLFKQNSFDDVNTCMKSSCLALNDQNKVVGFVIAKRWQESLDVPISKTTGWIQVLLVNKEYGNQGLGTKLLAHAEAELSHCGIKDIWLGKDTYHYFPGIPTQYAEVKNWFEKRGYEYQSTEYDLIKKYGKDGTEIPEIEDVEFSLVTHEDKDELLSFLKRCFPGRWEYEAIHYFEKGGTGREFVVLKKKGKIIGFCRINDPQSPFIAQNVYWSPLFDDDLGGAGPLGVDANERGQGYGLAIVEAGLAYLRQRDIKRIVIDWTGLVTFYNKLGYDTWKSYRTYKKVF